MRRHPFRIFRGLLCEMIVKFCPRPDPRKTLFQAGLIFCMILTVLPGLRVGTAYLITIHTGQKLDCDARSFLSNCP
jgi:hypothetical protein